MTGGVTPKHNSCFACLCGILKQVIKCGSQADADKGFHTPGGFPFSQYESTGERPTNTRVAVSSHSQPILSCLRQTAEYQKSEKPKTSSNEDVTDTTSVGITIIIITRTTAKIPIFSFISSLLLHVLAPYSPPPTRSTPHYFRHATASWSRAGPAADVRKKFQARTIVSTASVTCFYWSIARLVLLSSTSLHASIFLPVHASRHATP